MFRDKQTGQYPVSREQVRKLLPDKILPKDFTDVEGYEYIHPAVVPDYNPTTQTIERNGLIYDKGVLRYSVVIRDLSAIELEENLKAKMDFLRQGVVTATQDRLDSFARTRNYDGILSACTYATSSIPKFAAEGQVAVNLRDATWAALYQILEEVQAGQREAPTGFSDIEPLLPPLEWPV